MMDIDAYATSLLEMSKRFLEKGSSAGDEESAQAFFTAALLIGVSALEAHVNAIAEEVAERPGLEVIEVSLLREREYRLEKGQFLLVNSLKMYRLDDRLEFLFKRFTKAASPRSEPWWGQLQAALDLRNDVVHPKSKPHVT